MGRQSIHPCLESLFSEGVGIGDRRHHVQPEGSRFEDTICRSVVVLPGNRLSLLTRFELHRF